MQLEYVCVQSVMWLWIGCHIMGGINWLTGIDGPENQPFNEKYDLPVFYVGDNSFQ